MKNYIQSGEMIYLEIFNAAYKAANERLRSQDGFYYRPMSTVNHEVRALKIAEHAVLC